MYVTRTLGHRSEAACVHTSEDGCHISLAELPDLIFCLISILREKGAAHE